MQIFHDLTSSLNVPQALTIGNFDGLHLGHVALFKKLRTFPQPSAAITFANHPSEVLTPKTAQKLICTQEHKIRLLEKQGIDTLFLLPFTEEFSKQSAEEFLQNVLNCFPISSLILGEDATIGKNRSGDKAHLQILSQKLNFALEYVTSFNADGEKISSRQIRSLIQQGELQKVKAMLGRPYSILSKITGGKGRGHKLGFPTANLEVANLCLPPLGVWSVKVLLDGQSFTAVANLGFAPTVRHDNIPILEVHLLNFPENDIHGRTVEVIFLNYLRPEKKFSSTSALKEQIQHDIAQVKKL